jgi:hypothetical protein
MVFGTAGIIIYIGCFFLMMISGNFGVAIKKIVHNSGPRVSQRLDLLETCTVYKEETAEGLLKRLTELLAELDAIDAQVAAAHLDQAIHALRHQFADRSDTSNTE